MTNKKKQYPASANVVLGPTWDQAKRLADQTPLSASGFVRELIRRYGAQLVQDFRK